MSESIIELKNVYKSFRLPHEQHSGIKQAILNVTKKKKGYETQQVLNDISFEIKKGEFFGIVGRNGSGKSTLLKLLAGIYVPDKGLIKVNGSLTPFIELGVGFNPELTGRENVFMNGALLGFSRKEMEGMYQEIVEFAELGRFMDQKLKNYSSGMQVRLAFSIAVRAKSDILLIDEVLAVGDTAFQRKCFEYFEILRRDKDTTIVFITHDMDAVNRFCDRAILVENGKIKKEGSPRAIADQYKQDNILVSPQKTQREKDDPKKKVKITLDKSSIDEKDILHAHIKYDTSIQEDHYIGVSLLSQDRSFAEYNSSKDLILKESSESGISFHLPTHSLNPGVYEFTAAVFSAQNKTLLQYAAKGETFIVKGFDDSRGSAMRLEGEWRID